MASLHSCSIMRGISSGFLNAFSNSDNDAHAKITLINKQLAIINLNGIVKIQVEQSALIQYIEGEGYRCGPGRVGTGYYLI